MCIAAVVPSLAALRDGTAGGTAFPSVVTGQLERLALYMLVCAGDLSS